jgi:hypothetical protein
MEYMHGVILLPQEVLKTEAGDETRGPEQKTEGRSEGRSELGVNYYIWDCMATDRYGTVTRPPTPGMSDFNKNY